MKISLFLTNLQYIYIIFKVQIQQKIFKKQVITTFMTHLHIINGGGESTPHGEKESTKADQFLYFLTDSTEEQSPQDAQKPKGYG